MKKYVMVIDADPIFEDKFYGTKKEALSAAKVEWESIKKGRIYVGKVEAEIDESTGKWNYLTDENGGLMNDCTPVWEREK